MGAPVTTESIWDELQRHSFAVLGMVNAKGQARTAGIVYMVHGRTLYIATAADSWKAKHVGGNGHVSMTVCIPKRVPFMPFIKVPAATITFRGRGRVLAFSEAPAEAQRTLVHGLSETGGADAMRILEVTPEGDFVTYGVGVPLLTMRDTRAARGRAAVA